MYVCRCPDLFTVRVRTVSSLRSVDRVRALACSRAWRRPRPAGSRPAARLAPFGRQQLVAVRVARRSTASSRRRATRSCSAAVGGISASRQAVDRHHCCVDDRWRAAMTPAGSWPSFSSDWCDRPHRAHERRGDLAGTVLGGSRSSSALMQRHVRVACCSCCRHHARMSATRSLAY